MNEGAGARLPRGRPEATHNSAPHAWPLLTDGDEAWRCVLVLPQRFGSHRSPTTFRATWPKTPREAARTTSTASPTRNAPLLKRSRRLPRVTNNHQNHRRHLGTAARMQAEPWAASRQVVPRERGETKSLCPGVMVSVCSLLPLTTFFPSRFGFLPFRPGSPPCSFRAPVCEPAPVPAFPGRRRGGVCV